MDVFDENVTELEFEVEHEKMPPSNIHVLIGKNGVGKTTLLKDMINALEENGENHGKFQTWGRKGFANVVYVSFSAFDGFLDNRRGSCAIFIYWIGNKRWDEKYRCVSKGFCGKFI